MRSKSISLLTIISSLMIIPLVSANLAVDFFNNDWIKFAIVFILLFAILYSFLKPRFNYSAAPTTVVSAGVSILLTMPIMQRGILEAFISPEIIDSIAAIAVIIGLLLLVFFVGKKVGWKGIIPLILLLGVLIYFAKDSIPETLMYGPFGTVIDYIQGFSFFIAWIVGIVVIIWLFWIFYLKRKSGYKRLEKESYHTQRGEINAKQDQVKQRLRQRQIANQSRAQANAKAQADAKAWRNARRDKKEAEIKTEAFLKQKRVDADKKKDNAQRQAGVQMAVQQRKLIEAAKEQKLLVAGKEKQQRSDAAKAKDMIKAYNKCKIRIGRNMETYQRLNSTNPKKAEKARNRAEHFKKTAQNLQDHANKLGFRLG